MKWFLVALMATIYMDGSRNTYVWTTPHFESVEQCQQYAQENANMLRYQLFDVFPSESLESIWCFNEDMLQKFLDMSTAQPKIGT
tara:strand:- start:2096 stop:2350 length:255 start_codon:yes stop_codon:yes gene_type:complete